MSATEGKPEYRTPDERSWKLALDAEKELDRALAEWIKPEGRVGATEDDVLLAAQILNARAAMAAADAAHLVRQELTLIGSKLSQLSRDKS